MMPTGVSLDVGRILDDGRWGGYQQWLVFLTALAVVFDGIDNQLLGIVIPTIMKEWAVPRSVFAPLVALGYFGMMVGGAVAVLAGDRVGRKTALIGSMVVFGLMTLAAAAAGSPGQLGLLRLLAGIGLGGALPNAASLTDRLLGGTMQSTGSGDLGAVSASLGEAVVEAILLVIVVLLLFGSWKFAKILWAALSR